MRCGNTRPRIESQSHQGILTARVPPLSKDKALKKEFLELFRCGDDKAEKLAVARHEALRERIADAERSKFRRQDGHNPKKRARPE